MSRMQISSPQHFLRNYSAVKNNSSPILRPTLPAFPYPLPVATYIHPRTLFAIQVCYWWRWRGGVQRSVTCRASGPLSLPPLKLRLCLTPRTDEGEYTGSSSFRFTPDVTVSYTHCIRSRVCFVETKRKSVCPSAWYGSSFLT